jgi:hypothetical protein
LLIFFINVHVERDEKGIGRKGGREIRVRNDKESKKDGKG